MKITVKRNCTDSNRTIELNYSVEMGYLYAAVECSKLFNFPSQENVLQQRCATIIDFNVNQTK